MTTTTSNEALAERYAAAWAAHDLDAVMADHTPETVFQLHDGSAPAVGAEAVRATFALVLSAYPDLSATTERLGVGLDHLVVESRMQATIEGELRSVDAVDVFQLEGGRIARKDTYLDTAAIDPAR